MGSSSEFYRVLAECIEAVEAEQTTVADCLVRYPEHRAELGQLLPLVTALHHVPRVEPPAGFRNGARQRLLSQLPATDPVVTNRPSPRYKGQRVGLLSWRRRFNMTWIAAIALIVSLLAGGGLAYAADGAAPGDPLYALDRAIEDVQLSLIRDRQAAFEFQLALAAERLEEADKLLSLARQELFHEALDHYDATVAAVAEAVQSSVDADQAALGGMLDEAIASHDTILVNLAYGERDGEMVQIRDRDRDHWCLADGEDLHPVAERLADRYDVTYEEIIGWFCDGFGLGEIGIAYRINDETGTPVDDLFWERRESNMGWGLILQAEGLIGRPDHAGPPEDVPQGPPADVPQGPPDHSGRPEDAGPPADVPQGPPADVPQGPPDREGGFENPGPPAGVPQGRPADKGLPPGQDKTKP
jgi:hypothetical protein